MSVDIDDVIINLIRSGRVFYASLLMQMIKVPLKAEKGDATATTAVSVQNGRLYLYYNIDFLNTLTLPEAIAVIEHECMHCLLGHIARKKARDHQLWNISCDLAANQYIQNLPEMAVTLDKFPASWKMKPNQLAEQYYDVLDKKSTKIDVSVGENGRVRVSVKDGDGKTRTMEGQCGGEEWDGEGVGDGSNMPEELKDEVVKQAIAQAYDEHKRTKSRGSMPAHLESVIEARIAAPELDWKKLLDKYVAQSVRCGKRLSWKRPNRRFGSAFQGKVPSRKLRLTVAIDTSGSIGSPEFKTFIDKIKTIMTVYKSDVTVLEADAEVQKQYKLTRYGKVQTNFKGRGGTSFKPVFDYVVKHKIGTDLLIYFTDLWGDHWTKKPTYPVVWACTSDETTVPFGKVIKVKVEDADENNI